MVQLKAEVSPVCAAQYDFVCVVFFISQRWLLLSLYHHYWAMERKPPFYFLFFINL